MRSIAKWLLFLLALAVLGAFGKRDYENRLIASAAAQEQRRQRPEIQECRKRLGQFHTAWLRYKSDHAGSSPPDLGSFVPRYVKPKSLTCPTAAYWMNRRFAMEHGVLTVNRRCYPMTYGVRWLTGGYARSMRIYANSAPLIVCESHGEALYRVAYGRRPPLGAFSEEQRRQWVPEISRSRAIAVLINGDIIEVDPAAL